jgi:hypothetical protein
MDYALTRFHYVSSDQRQDVIAHAGVRKELLCGLLMPIGYTRARDTSRHQS